MITHEHETSLGVRQGRIEVKLNGLDAIGFLSQFPDGTYFLRLIGPETQYVKTIVKED